MFVIRINKCYSIISLEVSMVLIMTDNIWILICEMKLGISFKFVHI
jgi:hypothetical protein